MVLGNNLQILLLSVLVYSWLIGRLVVNCGRSVSGRVSGQRAVTAKSSNSRVGGYLPPRSIVYRPVRGRRRGSSALINPLITRSISSQRTPLARFATFSKFFFPWFKIFKSPFCPLKPCLSCGGGGGGYDDDYGPVIDPDLYPPYDIPSPPIPVLPSGSTSLFDNHPNQSAPQPKPPSNLPNDQHGSNISGNHDDPFMDHDDLDAHDDKDHDMDSPPPDKDTDKDMGGDDTPSGDTSPDNSDEGDDGSKDPASVSEESKKRRVRVNDRSTGTNRGPKSSLYRSIRTKTGGGGRSARGGNNTSSGVGNSELRLITNDKRKAIVTMGNRQQQQVTTRNLRLPAIKSDN